MKLEIARGLFLLGALGIASLALAAWEQPRTEVLSAAHNGGQCPVPRIAKTTGGVRSLIISFCCLCLGCPKG